jgi:hypothetical protein
LAATRDGSADKFWRLVPFIGVCLSVDDVEPADGREFARAITWIDRK